MGSVHTGEFSSNARLPSELHARYLLNFSAPDLGIHYERRVVHTVI
jgi:hypothetical protein